MYMIWQESVQNFAFKWTVDIRNLFNNRRWLYIWYKRFLQIHPPTKTKSLLHSQKQATGGISLHVNAKKSEFMWFQRQGAISTLNDG